MARQETRRAGAVAGAEARTGAAGLSAGASAGAGAAGQSATQTAGRSATQTAGRAQSPAGAETSSTRSRRARRAPTVAFGSRTDVGCVREQNEDSLVVHPPLFAVADGMGGHAAGEIASEIAVKTLEAHAPAHPDAEALGRAVEEANRNIINAALAGEGREGMGTTCTAAVLEKDRLVLAQVGDSRAYLLHAGHLVQITRDHSLMADLIEAGQITPAEARVHPNRSVITRALGSDPATAPDLYEMNVEAGDRLLLCSDGLTGMVEDKTIEAILSRVENPQLAAAQLVKEAIAAGGQDNVTVVVVDAEGQRQAAERKVVRRSRAWIAVVVVLLAAVLAAAGYGGYKYLHHVAYLANEDGKVAIYQGVPDDILGFTYHELVEVTDVDVSVLPPSAAERVNAGLRVDSLEDAQDLVESYRTSFVQTAHPTTSTDEEKEPDASASNK